MTATHRNIVSPPGLGPEQEDGQAGEADGAQEAVAAAGLLQRGGHVAHLALELQTKQGWKKLKSGSELFAQDFGLRDLEAKIRPYQCIYSFPSNPMWMNKHLSVIKS